MNNHVRERLPAATPQPIRWYYNPGQIMPRHATTLEQRARGEALAMTLSQHRRARGLTQEQLARDADVSLDTLRALEAKRTAAPSFFLVTDLSRVLAVSLDDVAQSASGEKQ